MTTSHLACSAPAEKDPEPGSFRHFRSGAGYRTSGLRRKAANCAADLPLIYRASLPTTTTNHLSECCKVSLRRFKIDSNSAICNRKVLPLSNYYATTFPSGREATTLLDMIWCNAEILSMRVYVGLSVFFAVLFMFITKKLFVYWCFHCC